MKSSKKLIGKFLIFISIIQFSCHSKPTDTAKISAPKSHSIDYFAATFTCDTAKYIFDNKKETFVKINTSLVGESMFVIFNDSIDIAAIDLQLTDKQQTNLNYALIVNESDIYYKENKNVVTISRLVKQLRIIFIDNENTEYYTAYSDSGKRKYSKTKAQSVEIQGFILYNNKWEEIKLNLPEKTPIQTKPNHRLPQKEFSIHFQKGMRFYVQSDSITTLKGMRLDKNGNFIYYTKEKNTHRLTNGKIISVETRLLKHYIKIVGEKYLLTDNGYKTENISQTVILENDKCLIDKDTIRFIPKDNDFIDMRTYGSNYSFDMKYATKENFTGKVLYDCDECLLRYSLVKAIEQANESFNSR